MHKKAVLALGTISSLAGIAAFTTHRYINDIVNRFPEYDRKDLRSAYGRMMLKSLRGQYPDIESYSDLKMDAVFLEELHSR